MNKNKFRISNVVMIITLVSISLFCVMCKSQKKSFKQSSDIVGVKMDYQIPTFGNMDLYGRDSIFIFYYKDIILYGFPYTYSIEDEDSILFEERRLKCFLFRQNDQYGYYFDKVDDTVYKKLNVDTLLATTAFKGILYSKTNDSLVEVQKTKNGMIEKYIPIHRYDYSYSDTTIFYYTKKEKFYKFSLADDLEKAKKKKIFKIRAIYNGGFTKEVNGNLPYREFIFSISKTKYKGSEDLHSLLNYFEKISFSK